MLLCVIPRFLDFDLYIKNTNIKKHNNIYSTNPACMYIKIPAIIHDIAKTVQLLVVLDDAIFELPFL